MTLGEVSVLANRSPVDAIALLITACAAVPANLESGVHHQHPHHGHYALPLWAGSA